MAHNISNQKNPWGTQRAEGGLEPQRADLWIVDIDSAVRKIRRVLSLPLPEIQYFYAQSVALPELVVRPDQFRRDSRPYNMPSFDEPLQPVRITFLVDNTDDEQSSDIYTVLDAWRTVVRAGRGAMSSERQVFLNENFRIDFAFNIYVMLVKGGHALIETTTAKAKTKSALTSQQPSGPLFSIRRDPSALNQIPTPLNAGQASQQQTETQQQAALFQASVANQLSGLSTSAVQNDLQSASLYALENAWLSSFRINELNYASNQLLTIEAQFYADNIVDHFAQFNKIPETPKILS
jgi:hypothetical protein